MFGPATSESRKHEAATMFAPVEVVADAPPEYKPRVIGTIDGAITSYSEAYRLACAKRLSLVVCYQQTEAVVRRELQAADDRTIVCVVSSQEFPEGKVPFRPGVHRYAWRRGRLLKERCRS